MLPDWFTKPESIFRTILWLLGPFLTYSVGKFVLTRVEAWHAARTLEIAKINLTYYRRRLENPPSLFEQVALIVCLLPAPIALIFMVLFLQNPPDWMLVLRSTNRPQAFQSFRTAVYFFNYVMFGVLGFYGVQAAYRLRHGEARYVEHYSAGVQKKIDKLLKKFPELGSISKAS
jgi:hypothetical protein